MIGFIALIHSRLVTTSNYSATANLHNSQFTTTPAMPFPARCVFNNRSLAPTSNSGDSSASRAHALPSPTLVQNCLSASAQLNWIVVSSQPPAGLVTTFYCLKFETSPTWRARPLYLYPQEQRGPVIPPGTGFPFRRLLRLAGL
jgi:hypothetical protein